MSKFLSLEDTLLMKDIISRHAPLDHASCEYYEPARPYIIHEEDDADDAAPSVNIPRLRESERSRKRASLPPMKASFYRTADSLISRRTAFTPSMTGIQYRSQFEDVTTSGKSSWESSRPDRISIKSSGSRTTSKAPSILQPRIFQSLPREIYASILQQLEVLHFGVGSQRCTTCYLRDLYNVSLTSRAWDKSARTQLYSSLWIPPPDSLETKRPKSKSPGRLKLLRKTLRDRGALAKLVCEIKALELQQVFLQSNYNEGQEIINDLASIVMACPNLERLVGFHWIYNHEFDRLNHALSTRPNLKERVWMIDKPVNHGLVLARKKSRAAFDLYPGPTELFLHHHDYCTNLKTLFLHGQGTGIMDFRSFVATFRKLQQLENLHISNFSAEDFNDRTLAALPSLRSLRLEGLNGVTDKGLLRFSQSPAARSIRSLSLIHQELLDLFIITSFFQTCTSLARFTIVQDGSPGVVAGVALYRPIFSSHSVRYLHWDILMPGAATEELALSIASGAFPALRKIRAPVDHDGLLQDLCRPVSNIMHEADARLINHKLTREKTMSDSMAPESSNGSNNGTSYSRNLPAARRAAQSRIDTASSASSVSLSSSINPAKPQVQVIVEEDGVVLETFTFQSYMGTVSSHIEYCLEPDMEGAEEAVIGVHDLMVPGKGGVGAGIGPGRGDFCTGAGKRIGTGFLAGEKGIGRTWWHGPREKVRLVELMDFF